MLEGILSHSKHLCHMWNAIFFTTSYCRSYHGKDVSCLCVYAIAVKILGSYNPTFIHM